MFYLAYVLSEIRRRSGRTVLTALGLAVGVALVVAVNALSTGLDQAQAKVLAPLTGVGTDMSVTRPLTLSTNGGNPFANLSPQERQQLQKENGGARLGLRNIAKPGQHFSSDRFLSAGQLSLPASDVKKIASLKGVQQAAGSLTLSDTHISGTVPKQAPGQGSGVGIRRFGQGGTGGFAGPNNINFNSRTITGIDESRPALASITPGQITNGHYLTSSEGPYAAVLSSAYAKSQNLSVGSTLKLGGKTFHVVGLASAPLGGSASDIYVKLSTLQTLSSRVGRVTTIQVRATSGSQVSSVKKEVTASIAGAQVTTAADLAKRVTGSLIDAKNLSNTLGTSLEIVGLLAALLIACLLTLSSVAKRTREIGTLRAIGWSRVLVIRQISLETLLQGLVGGVIGAALGAGAAAVVSAMGLPLKATVAGPSAPAGPFGFGRFAQSSVNAGSSIVHITAPVNLSLILAAVGLAILGGLLAGAVGGLRAARLRPAVALRTVE